MRSGNTTDRHNLRLFPLRHILRPILSSTSSPLWPLSIACRLDRSCTDQCPSAMESHSVNDNLHSPDVATTVVSIEKTVDVHRVVSWPAEKRNVDTTRYDIRRVHHGIRQLLELPVLRVYIACVLNIPDSKFMLVRAWWAQLLLRGMYGSTISRYLMLLAMNFSRALLSAVRHSSFLFAPRNGKPLSRRLILSCFCRVHHYRYHPVFHSRGNARYF
jgi:hypothetical protein